MKLASSYDFYYKLTEEDRVSLVGHKIWEVGSLKKQAKHCVYYVIGLNDDCFNYGFKQGLIGLIKPTCHYFSKTQMEKFIKHNQDPYWFKIYAHSPDDLDLALHFSENKGFGKEYQKVKKFMDKYCSTFINTSYEEVFKFAQKELDIGEIGL